MKIRILQLLEGAEMAAGVTVIIDVFRAFTLEAFLAGRGARAILPVADIGRAYAMKQSDPEVILIGERHGRKCEGFDFGNSPSEIEKIDFRGKTVVHTTSAGTQGIAAARNADVILTGSLVNARAVAEYIRSLDPEEVSLVCMGWEAKEETEEDTLCAGYIRSLLLGEPFDLASGIENLKIPSGAKFFDKAQNDVFPERDFTLCTDADRFGFVLRVEKSPDGSFHIVRI